MNKYDGFFHNANDHIVVKIYTPLFLCDGYCGIIIDHHLIGRGYAVMENDWVFSPEDIFDLCNWEHTSQEKPVNLYSDLNTVGHGFVVEDPRTGDFWLALSHGWFKGTQSVVEAEIEIHELNNWHNVIKTAEKYGFGEPDDRCY